MYFTTCGVYRDICILLGIYKYLYTVIWRYIDAYIEYSEKSEETDQ